MQNSQLPGDMSLGDAQYLNQLANTLTATFQFLKNGKSGRLRKKREGFRHPLQRSTIQLFGCMNHIILF